MGAQQRGRELRPGALPCRAKLRLWNADGSLDPNGPDSRRSTEFRSTSTAWDLRVRTASRRGLVENDYNTLQPRVGFSEDLFGNGKTVLRGGFGTFFERMQGNDIYNAATNSAVRLQPRARTTSTSLTRARAG